MKHSIKVTAILILMFIVAQLIGIAVISLYPPIVNQVIIPGTNETINETVYNLPYGLEPPQTSPEHNIASIIISFTIAVLLLLFLMKYRVELIIRTWFFLVIVLALGVTFYAFFKSLPYAAYSAIVLALLLAYLKVFKRNIIAHNFTEVLIYPGLAALFVPLLNITTGIILFLIISIYDIYAVWHAKFMQKMAKYQINNLKIFSGFLIPYRLPSQKKSKKSKSTKKEKFMIAMLGGGDVVFPIILSGVLLNTWGLTAALLVSLGATIALTVLFIFSEKGKFYPAMPFITVGCFLGLLAGYLIRVLG